MTLNPTTPAATRLSLFRGHWLQIAAAGVAAFALALVLLPAPMQRVFSGSPSPRPPARHGSAPSGGLRRLRQRDAGYANGGLGATMLFVVARPLRRGERAGRWMLALPLALWFVADMGFSITSGFWRSAGFDTGFLAMFALPLAATWRSFFGR